MFKQNVVYKHKNFKDVEMLVDKVLLKGVVNIILNVTWLNTTTKANYGNDVVTVKISKLKDWIIA